MLRGPCRCWRSRASSHAVGTATCWVRNSPFNDLAQAHPGVVCAMNLALPRTCWAPSPPSRWRPGASPSRISAVSSSEAAESSTETACCWQWGTLGEITQHHVEFRTGCRHSTPAELRSQACDRRPSNQPLEGRTRRRRRGSLLRDAKKSSVSGPSSFTSAKRGAATARSALVPGLNLARPEAATTSIDELQGGC